MNRLSPEIIGIPSSEEADGARAARAEWRLEMLGQLAEMGMRLAREVERQAMDAVAGDEVVPAVPAGRGGGVGSGGDFGLTFARIARAVRQTLALQARLDSEAGLQAVAARTGREAAERKRVKQTKDRVRGCVEDAIRAGADGGDAEALLLDLDERLDDPEIVDELGSRPIGVIVAGICDDLGVKVDLRYFSDAELGFDMATMRPGAVRGAGTAGVDGVEARDGAGRDGLSGDAGALVAGGFPCASGADRSADTGGPPPAVPWPAFSAVGRAPPEGDGACQAVNSFEGSFCEGPPCAMQGGSG